MHRWDWAVVGGIRWDKTREIGGLRGFSRRALRRVFFARGGAGGHLGIRNGRLEWQRDAPLKPAQAVDEQNLAQDHEVGSVIQLHHVGLIQRVIIAGNLDFPAGETL